MDIAANSVLIEDAFGPGADIFKDVLKVPPSAPQSQVQQAFFVSRHASEKPFPTLNMYLIMDCLITCAIFQYRIEGSNFVMHSI